jgi:hypothetical protein
VYLFQALVFPFVLILFLVVQVSLS